MMILGSDTRPYPASLKHFFKATERSGEDWHDDAGGVVWRPSASDGIRTVRDYNGSRGTLAMIGTTSGSSKPIDLYSGAWHTFAGTKATLFVCAARKFIDPYLVYGTDPQLRGFAAGRIAIGDINNLGTNTLSQSAAPAGIGLAGGPFHAAMGHDATWATAQYGITNIVRVDPTTTYKLTTGDIAEPDTTNYPPPPITTNFLVHNDWKFDYDAWYPYRNSPPSARVQRDELLVFARDPNTATYSYTLYNLDTGARWILADETVVADSIALPVQPSPCMRVHNLAIYGYAAFEFDSGLPSDWSTGASWMGKRWKTGERVVYPKW